MGTPIVRLTDRTGAFNTVYQVVVRIPRGRVATYGQISRLLDRYSPVFVGWALHALPGDRSEIPWHRVLSSRGTVSTRQVLGYARNLQQHLLESEGVEFDEQGRCDLKRFQWDGVTRRRRR